ncbi:hypothetical protein QYF61_005973 [Mycteria americana]|uniref:Uncharacterized protein n=1 Tax=Mycteria americana TaxID=33587 RepID=A0AAN7NPG6_MYCAM|nr:hypothetical protein QYF61_005973 [Mycteria americana]
MKGRNAQFKEVWEVPTRILKRPAKESLSCYRLTPQFAEVGVSWRILERENREIRQIQTQLSPEHQKDAEAIHLIQTSFKYLQGWRLHHFPGQPVPVLDNPFSEVKFPNIQSKPPLAQPEAISSRPITCYLGEETDPTSLHPPFRQL